MKKFLFLLIAALVTFASPAQVKTNYYDVGTTLTFNKAAISSHPYFTTAEVKQPIDISFLSEKKERKDGGLVIGKAVEFITPEQFNPDTAVFKIISIGDSTVTFYYWLREITTGQNHSGQTVREGNATIPKAYVDALDIKYDGSVGNETALTGLLAGFNLKRRE